MNNLIRIDNNLFDAVPPVKITIEFSHSYSELLPFRISSPLRQGFLTLLLMVLRLAPDALAMVGLPCISYIFLNSATHGRTRKRPYGFENSRAYVKQANQKLGMKLGCTFSFDILINVLHPRGLYVHGPGVTMFS